MLPGVTIGDGATVAGGAVVTKDVQPYTLASGSWYSCLPGPARRGCSDGGTVQWDSDLPMTCRPLVSQPASAGGCRAQRLPAWQASGESVVAEGCRAMPVIELRFISTHWLQVGGNPAKVLKRLRPGDDRGSPPI